MRLTRTQMDELLGNVRQANEENARGTEEMQREYYAATVGRAFLRSLRGADQAETIHGEWQVTAARYGS